MAKFNVIAESIATLLKVGETKDISKAHILLSLISNIQTTDSGKVYFNVCGKKFYVMAVSDDR